MIGEDPRDIPNNLMPFISKVATGELPKISVFGDDYDTPDGTGVRDYIHVEDLARGHVLSLARLFETGEGHLVNLGTGRGYSVLEVIAAYKRASNRDLPYDIVDRRPGDVPIYVARAEKAAEVSASRPRNPSTRCAPVPGPGSRGRIRRERTDREKPRAPPDGMAVMAIRFHFTPLTLR
jgi:UDP-glucose 4-epimerase